MNLPHRRLCSSRRWADAVAQYLPDELDDLDLDDVLEIGPGFGATTRLIAPRARALTAVEIDEASVHRLRAEFEDAGGVEGRVEIVHGDGAVLPFDDARFSAVVCFTMLHHVPTTAAQDALFAEARRVLRPGGTFRGVDSQLNPGFWLLHIADTMTVLDAGTLDDRLRAAGFDDVAHTLHPRVRVRFTARRA